MFIYLYIYIYIYIYIYYITLDSLTLNFKLYSYLLHENSLCTILMGKSQNKLETRLNQREKCA